MQVCHAHRGGALDRSATVELVASCDETNAEIRRVLGQLDGTASTAVSLMTGVSVDELDDLGGLPA